MLQLKSRKSIILLLSLDSFKIIHINTSTRAVIVYRISLRQSTTRVVVLWYNHVNEIFTTKYLLSCQKSYYRNCTKM